MFKIQALVSVLFIVQCQPIQNIRFRTLQVPEAPSLLQIEGAAEKRERFEFTGKEFVIATDHPLASSAGLYAWKAGGNVVDAFVAASFVVSIVRPHSTGLLGGGFAVINLDQGKTKRAFDFRERAPIAGRKEAYVDNEGKPIPGKTVNGPFSAATPGMIPGLLLLQKRYGRLPLAKVLEPSIQIAKSGFAIYGDLARVIKSNWELMNPEMKEIFGKEGRPLLEGEPLVQIDLSTVLERLALLEEMEIREGQTAEKIAKFYVPYQEHIRLQDLKNYKVNESEPIVGYAFGKKIITMPPPSSAVHLLTIFQLLAELQNRKSLPTGEVGEIIRLTESMRVGYRDRAELGGDPKFTKIDVQSLLSQVYIKTEANAIERKIVSGAWTSTIGDLKTESYNTTHISVMDKDGNAVSSTQSINGSLGAKIVVPGTGLILNNTMDDFAVAPGFPNIYGLLGSNANAIEPGKTPLSSMSPMILLDDSGKSEIAIGAPGGSQIPTTILNTLYQYKTKGLSLYESASHPRYHHQYQPDILFVEPEAKVRFPLTELPFYQVQYVRHRAKVFAVAREKDELIGVSDPRGEGVPLGF
ncbi:gamma-glutamyltransferase [Leptospira ognonensis]|uniref:Glutathione hydrolase proenzyme n=1 Tax=Leptospira ognonensis TaxID=2484945 RepID=A0A4R9JWZ1_9LEPT|nr:gamma-glutamyltransferase [Leptospira ognonensis]